MNRRHFLGALTAAAAAAAAPAIPAPPAVEIPSRCRRHPDAEFIPLWLSFGDPELCSDCWILLCSDCWRDLIGESSARERHPPRAQGAPTTPAT